MALRFRIPFVKRGDPVRAEYVNKMAEAVNAVPEVTVGAGLQMTKGDGVLVLSVKPANGEALYGIITAATGGDSDFLENIRYSAQVRGRPEAKVTARLPDFGRSGQGQDYRARPCRVGCPCIIYRIPDATGEVKSYLEILEGGELGELKLFRRCGTARPAIQETPPELSGGAGSPAPVVPTPGDPGEWLFDDADNSDQALLVWSE